MNASPRHTSLLGTLAAVLRVLVVGMFLLTFVIQPFRIPTPSMVPTLEVGDFVLVSKTAFMAPLPAQSLLERIEARLLPPAEIHRGDLIVFHFPPHPDRLLVKRVVGMGRDRLHLRTGHVFLDDQPLPEPYALYLPSRPDVFRDEFPNLREASPDIDPYWWLTLRRTLRQDGNLLIPSGRFFVLGDNRNNSEDSRYWGFVPTANIVGRPLLVYFSLPNGADAPEGGPMARLRWVAGWVRQRVGVLH